MKMQILIDLTPIIGKICKKVVDFRTNKCIELQKLIFLLCVMQRKKLARSLLNLRTFFIKNVKDLQAITYQ